MLRLSHTVALFVSILYMLISEEGFARGHRPQHKTPYSCANQPPWQKELQTQLQQNRLPSWMLEQIHEELEPFKETGISLQDIEDTRALFPNSVALCTIEKNQFSIDYPEDFFTNTSGLFGAATYGQMKMYVEAMQTLTQAVALPDVTFLISIPEAFTGKGNNKAPIFAWCKHRENSPRVVLIPDYDALNGNHAFLEQVQEGSQSYPWEKKIPIAFWRGVLTGDDVTHPRVKLVQVSARFPEQIDAKLVDIYSHRRDQMLHLLSAYLVKEPVPVRNHLKYKGQISIDGNVSDFSRFYWQLFSNCVVFKQKSPWYQWFYRGLRPFEHYIPFEAAAQDLPEKVRWMQKHDIEAHRISTRANAFAYHNLRHSCVLGYFCLLCIEYAKLQRIER